MRNKGKRTAAAILAVLLILSMLGSSVLMAAAAETNITISSVEDLESFVKNCALDSWSQGKTVTLTADLDLTDSDFTPIPTFGGTFDGGGHTISGLSLTADGSCQGLFRYVQEGAVVRNLKVEGSVTPGGTQEYVGGLVGSNSGSLISCSFSGTVEGDSYVGGLVGINEESGTVSSCSVSGSVVGKHSTGGVVGQNLGQITGSSNEAEVNISDYAAESSLETAETDQALLSEEDTDTMRLANSMTDTGGIAGYSAGTIQSSTNYGEVGYPHVGYNVGGIAGRSKGYVSSCRNEGQIYGRKDIGGIVGQMTPNLELRFDTDKINELEDQIDVLNDRIDTLIDHADANSEDLTDPLDKLASAARDAKNSAGSLADQASDLIETNIDNLENFSEEAKAAVQSCCADLEAAAGDLESMAAVVQQARQELKDILDGLDLTEEEKAALEGLLNEIQSESEKLAAGAAGLKEAAKGIREGLAAGTDLRTLYQQYAPAIQSNYEAIRSAQANLKTLYGQLAAALEKLGQDAQREFPEAARKAAETLKSTIEALESGTAALKTHLEKLKTDISGVDTPEIKKADSSREKTGDDLTAAVGSMADQLEKLGDGIDDLTGDLTDDMRSVSDQLETVMDAMTDLLSDDDDTYDSLEDRIVDVSEEEIEGTTKGKAYGCRNAGSVEGDVNVGGIAGSMAIEYDLDPEDDITKAGEETLNVTLRTRSIIQACVNEGAITAKKDCVGGVVGRMSLGLVTGSEGYGSVLSTNGNYVGGVAGYSASVIQNSYAKCTLEGEDYVGGIAGWGDTLKNCSSLIEVAQAEEFCGSIAGQVSEDGTLSGNTYVSDTLAAVDGISYAGKAEPVSYEALIQSSSAPTAFQNFTLNFVADGQVLKSVSFAYGEDLSEVEYPEIPKVDGYNGKWEEADLSCMTFSRDIHVLYTAKSTSVGSDLMRDFVHSTVLAEGSFSLDAKLILAEAEEDTAGITETGRVREQWTVSLRDPALDDAEEIDYKLRFIPPESDGSIDIYVLKDGNWEKASCTRDGSYLVFRADSTEVTFCVVEEPAASRIALVAAAVAAILAAGAGAVILIRKKRRKAAETSEQEEKKAEKQVEQAEQTEQEENDIEE